MTNSSNTKSRFGVGLAAYGAVLHDHVLHVLVVGTQKEVQWADTPSVVALVKHEDPLRDGTAGQLPGIAMDALHAASVGSKQAVSVLAPSASPDEAVANWFDAAFKALKVTEQTVVRQVVFLRETISYHFGFDRSIRGSI